MPNILRARINSNETNAQATLKTIGNAAENYFTTNSNYPTASNDLLNATPPYLGKDYFTGNFYGYTYAASWDIGGYSVLAEPTGPNQGTLSYTLSTGGIIQQN